MLLDGPDGLDDDRAVLRQIGNLSCAQLPELV